jgi:tetratricopeptide (TPR) repeat protein
MRVNSRWLVALLLLAVMPLCGCGFITKLKARDNLNKGVKAFTDQKYNEAAQFFQRSIELDPDFPEDVPRVYMATAYMLQFIPGSVDPKSEQMALKAIATFTEVVERSEKLGKPNVNAMLAIASLSYQMEKGEQTKEWCNRILALPSITPDDKKNQAEAHYRIAVLDFDIVNKQTGTLGENVEVLKEEDKAKIQKDIDEGLAHLGKSIEMRPDYFDAMMYQNLLWREKAKMEKDEAAKNELIHQADIAYNKSIQLKLKAEAEEAAKHKKLDLKK